MSLTQLERENLIHCLGYNYTPRMQRNQFLATDGSVDWHACDGLVKRGLMVNRGKVNLGVPETLFMATPAGEALVRPKSLTKAQQRYQRWLDVADCYPDWKFIDFCKADTNRKEECYP